MVPRRRAAALALRGAVGLNGPRDPGERSRALYLITAALRNRADDLGDQLSALMTGPHGDWAARERDAFAAGRAVGEWPIDLPQSRPGPEGG